jgi:hypothetical protein
MTSYPKNFIPIVDAFDQAVAALAPAKIAGPAKDPNGLSNAELVEFEDDLEKFAQRKDEAAGRVERLFRDALADGVIDAWVKDGAEMQVLSDRESWRPAAFGAPGFEPRTHHLTNPGPNDDREVVIDQGQLKTWLMMLAGAAPHRRGRPHSLDWEAVRIALYEKCKEQGGVPSPEIGNGWSTQADAERFVQVMLRDRGEKAADSTVRTHVAEMLRDYEGR